MELDFPKNPDEFHDDERISFSKLDNKFIAVHDNGSEFEFDARSKQWLPTAQEDVDELGDLAASVGADENPQKRKLLDAENGPGVSGPLPWLPALRRESQNLGQSRHRAWGPC